MFRSISARVVATPIRSAITQSVRSITSISSVRTRSHSKNCPCSACKCSPVCRCSRCMSHSRMIHTSRATFGGEMDYTKPTSDFLERDEVQTRVLAVMKNIEKLHDKEITAESTFTELGLDSLDTVEVVMQLEEEFCVDLYDQQAVEINGVKQAVDIFSNFPFAQ